MCLGSDISNPIASNERYVVSMVSHALAGNCVPEFFKHPVVFTNWKEAEQEAINLSERYGRQFAVWKAFCYTAEVKQPKYVTRRL